MTNLQGDFAVNDSALKDRAPAASWRVDYFLSRDAHTRVEQSRLRILETLYKDRGLRFEPGGWGYVPAQIYGEIDGLRFYFRLRYNRASLRLGPVNEALDKAIADKTNEFRRAQLEEHQKDCDEEVCIECTLLSHPADVNSVDQYYPMEVFAGASLDPVDETDDEYKGWLDIEEIVPVFKRLLNNLEYRELEDRISVRTLDMLNDQGEESIHVQLEAAKDEDERSEVISEAKNRLTKKYGHLLTR